MLDRPAPRKGAEPDDGREDSHHDQRQRQAQSEGVTLQHHPRKRPRASRPLAWVDELGREPADQGGDDGNRRDHAQTDPALVEPRGDGDEGDKERCYRRFEDAGYGHDSKLRRGITELGKRYVAGIQPQTLVWARRTRGRAVHRRRGVAMRPMRFRSRRSHFGFARRHGARSAGGKAPTNGCPRGLHVCV